MNNDARQETIWIARLIVSGKIPKWSVSDSAVLDMAKLIVELSDNKIQKIVNITEEADGYQKEFNNRDPGGLY